MLGSNWIAWSVVLHGSCGFGIGPRDCPHRAIEGRGEKLSFMAKNTNGEFLFLFWTIYRKFIFQVVFFPYSSYFIKLIENIFSLSQVYHHFKVFFAHIGWFFVISHAFCIYTYSILNLAINILTMDYGILTISSLSLPLFFHG